MLRVKNGVKLMKKFLKCLWILPIIMVTLIFGTLFLPNNKKDSMHEFQEFAESYRQLIQSQDPIENFEEIRLNLTKDLTFKNGSYMISADNFSKITGSKLSYLNNGELEISNSENTVKIFNNSNTLKINNSDFDVMKNASSVDLSNSIFSIEKVATSLGYEVVFGNDTLTLTRPFITKRLLVYSKANLDDFGASFHISGYDNLHIYQYDTENKTKEAYEYFSSLDKVNSVEVDAIITPANYEDENLVVTPLGLDDAFSYSSWGANAMSVNKYSEYLKENVGVENFPEIIVAVLDTGIDSDHIWFSNRLAKRNNTDLGANFSSSSNSRCVYEDIYGHGTHVSGIITDLTFSNVKILPIKVMNDSGYGYSSAIKMGIDYVTELRQHYNLNIVAMNMSFGTTISVGTTNHSDFQTKINKAYNLGILSVAAAGNDNEDCITSTPANIHNAITVSAVSQTSNTYIRPNWSNYGSYVDICAPGGNIRSAAVGGGTKLESGTSMAAPHISAVIALFYTDYNKNYSTSKIEELLDNSAIDLGETGWDKYYGEGLVNIEYANATVIDQVIFSNTTTDHTIPFTLTLSTNIPNAKIYYTINNDKPNINNANEYTLPLTINKTQKISAIAYIIENERIIAYSKIRTIMYCFYGQDIIDNYTVDQNGTLLGYSGEMLEITVPISINGTTIKAIGPNAFDNTYIESITLPSTVTKIGSQAFANCVNLEYIYAPNVTQIGIQSFLNCYSLECLTDEYFPELLSIDKYSFQNCYNLKTISLSKVKLVDYYSFYMKDQPNFYITSITLPTVTIIGESAFANCQALNSLDIPNIEIISSNAFINCNISGSLYFQNLEYLGSKAFYNNKSLTTVCLPKARIISSQAFYTCNNITTLNISSVEVVGNKAFYGCSAIIDLNIDNLHEASSESFSGMENLEEINLPKLQYAGKSSFFNMTKITSLNLPNIIKISAYAFSNTPKLSNVFLPSSLEFIDNLAFGKPSNSCLFNIYYNTIAHDFVKSNNLRNKNVATNNLFNYTTINKEIHITGYNYNDQYPENLIIPSYIDSLPVTKICANAFINCTNLYNLNISKLTTIEEFAFIGCTNLTSITLNSIETIERDAFKNCTALSEVNINNVSTIGDNAFYNCPNLLKVKFSKNITNIGSKALGYIADDKIIPTFAIIGYSDTVANSYAERLDITFHSIFNEITSFYYNLYDNNGKEDIAITLVDSYITGSLIIPSSYSKYTISKISTQAFMNCTFITGIILPETITTIEKQAFYNCILLEEINLENVTSIAEEAFVGCSSLINVNLEHLEEIPASCFYSCEKLTILNIPNVVTIKEKAFSYCYDLHTVISPNLKIIEKEAFAYCSSLENIDTLNIEQLGTYKSNTSYAGQVFVYCEKLHSAYFPNLKIITPSIFSSATSKVVIGDKLSKIYGMPFSNSITIYGYANSTIISYAQNNAIKYVLIDKLSIEQDLLPSTECLRFENLTLSIKAIGFEQTYQWYTTTDTIENGVAIEGATASSLTVNTDNIQNLNYYIVVTDWNGTSITSSICSVTVHNNTSKYIINIDTPQSNGTITNLGTNYVDAGTYFTIKFTPNEGCHISSLIIDEVELTKEQIQLIVDNNYTYVFDNISTDHSVSVTYDTAIFTISVIQSENGTISNPKESYDYGTSGFFYFTADKGYYVEHIIIDETPIEDTENTNEYLLSSITADHKISAKFSPRTDMKYYVNHYQQSTTNKGSQIYNEKFYNLESSVIEEGTTNEYTDAIAKSYIGFHVLPFENVEIDPYENKIVVNIYYNRETYTVNLFKSVGIDSVTGAGDYLYGQTVTIFAYVSFGYTFEKWTSGNEAFYNSSINVCYEFEITNQNVDFTATAVISDNQSGESDDNNNQTPPSEDDNTSTTPNNPNDTTTSNNNSSSKSGNGGGLIIVLGIVGLIIILIVVVIIKKSKNSRF